MNGVFSGKTKQYRILFLTIFDLAVLSFLHLPKLACVWRISSDPFYLMNLPLITLVHINLCLWGQDQEFTGLQNPCWFVKETHVQALSQTCWVTIHRVGTKHLYWHGISWWAGVDQPLETIHLDHESEHKMTHCLVMPSHCKEFLNMLRVEPYPFIHSLNEGLLGSFFFLFWGRRGGHCTRWWQYQDE